MTNGIQAGVSGPPIYAPSHSGAGQSSKPAQGDAARLARAAFSNAGSGIRTPAVQKDQAARIISKAWSGHRARTRLKEQKLDDLPENKLPLYFAIKKIKDVPRKELHSGAFDRLVESCIIRAQLTHNRAALRWLGYCLVGPLRGYDMWDTPIRKALLNTLDREGIPITDLANLTRGAFKEWQAQDEVEAGLTPSRQNADPSEPQRGPYSSSASDIKVTHGGGLWFLRDFLAGRNQGYPGEHGQGIFVSPRVGKRNQNDQDAWYANRSVSRCMDIPIRLKGTISAQLLVRVNNPYEAALRPDALGQLKSRHLESLDPQDGRYGRDTWLVLRDEFVEAMETAIGVTPSDELVELVSDFRRNPQRA
ncbi:MAG: hypothetical protein ACOYKZ_04510 [Chlamydiia bacterium]